MESLLLLSLNSDLSLEVAEVSHQQTTHFMCASYKSSKPMREKFIEHSFLCFSQMLLDNQDEQMIFWQNNLRINLQAHACNKWHSWRNMYTITRQRKQSSSIFCWIRSEQSPATVGHASFSKRGEKKNQEITKQAHHALISKLAVEGSFFDYFTLIHADVQRRTHTKFCTVKQEELAFNGSLSLDDLSTSRWHFPALIL